jgi:hypothetical protein
VHLSKEALDLFALAAASPSPEVDMVPHLTLETHARFHQRLHSIKLITLQAKTDYIRHVMQPGTGTNCNEIDKD